MHSNLLSNVVRAAYTLRCIFRKCCLRCPATRQTSGAQPQVDHDGESPPRTPLNAQVEGEPAHEGGGARLAFVRRQEALLAAAALSALAVPDRLSLNADKQSGRRSRLGFPLHDGGRHLGHASPALVAELAALRPTSRQPGCRAGAPFLDHYHGLRTMASTPAAVALFVEALDPETLALVGREIMRRLASRG